MGEVRVRDVEYKDLEELLRINESYVPKLSTLTLDKLKILQMMSSYFQLISIENKIIGFILAFEENKKYDSLNYKWFNDNYQNFIYIDRVVVIDDYQNKSLGKLLYEKIEQNFRNTKEYILAEVNIVPMNKQSIVFHQNNGFKKVLEKMYSEDYSVRFFEKKLIPKV